MTGNRWFESISLQRRVTQTSSADARSRPDPSEYERGADGQGALGASRRLGRRPGARRRDESFGPQRVRPDRPRDVLDALLPHVLEGVGELVSDLVSHHSREANATRLGETLQTCRDIHTVAEDVMFLDDHVAQVDPDAEPMRRSSRTSGSRSIIPRWISTAQRTAATTLENSASKPSLVFFTVRPLCSLIFGSTSSRKCRGNN